MSRYIDAEWLEDNAKEYSLGYYEVDEWATPLNILDSAPSIDIVRCGECKCRKRRVDFQNDYCIQHSKVLYSTDGYCSWGEREGE